MVTNNSKKSVFKCSALILTFVFLNLSVSSKCRAADYALLVQQSPVEGGSVEPGTGVHHLGNDTQVTLRAVPEPGYQFVTWLGDVDEPGAPVTTAYMDSPKIIIAVFERIQYESIAAADLLFSGPGGGSGLRASAGDISNTSGGGAIRRDFPNGGFLRFPDIDDDLDDDLLGPGDALMGPGDGEVPEPSSLLIMASAAILARLRQKKVKNRT